MSREGKKQLTRNAPYTVLLIDDHHISRIGVSQLISCDKAYYLIGETASGREGLALARSERPDIVLLDLNMKDVDAIELLKTLRDEKVASYVVVLTVSDAEDDIVASMRCGVSGYLLKDVRPDVLMIKLRQVLNGQIVLDEKIASRLASAVQKEQTEKETLDVQLTEREWQTLQLIAKGMSNRMISQTLAIKEATVKVHVRRLLKKLGLRSRLEASAWYFANQAKLHKGNHRPTRPAAIVPELRAKA